MNKEYQKIWIFTAIDTEDHWLSSPYIFKNKPTLKDLWIAVSQKDVEDIPFLKDFVHEIPDTELTEEILKELVDKENNYLTDAEEWYEDNPEDGETSYTVEDMEDWFTSIEVLGRVLLDGHYSEDYGYVYWLEEIPYIEN